MVLVLFCFVLFCFVLWFLLGRNHFVRMMHFVSHGVHVIVIFCVVMKTGDARTHACTHTCIYAQPHSVSRFSICLVRVCSHACHLFSRSPVRRSQIHSPITCSGSHATVHRGHRPLLLDLRECVRHGESHFYSELFGRELQRCNAMPCVDFMHTSVFAFSSNHEKLCPLAGAQRLYTRLHSSARTHLR